VPVELAVAVVCLVTRHGLACGGGGGESSVCLTYITYTQLQPGHYTNTYTTILYIANMGTKLSKTENKETNVKDGEVKIVDLDNEAATTTTTTNDEVENDKTLKGDSFDRSSGFSKSLRKSMRKIVGKKKNKNEKKDELVEKQDEKPCSSDPAEEKVEDNQNFKTAQQKARAEFFKEMYEEGKDEKNDTSDESNAEGTSAGEKQDTNDVSVSLIGSPESDENHDEGNQEETKTVVGTTVTIEISEDQVQVDHVTQDEQEIEKESLSAASTEHEVPNEVEEMQFVIVAEEEKSDETVTEDHVKHEQKIGEKEREQKSERTNDSLELNDAINAEENEDNILNNSDEICDVTIETDEKDTEIEDDTEESNSEDVIQCESGSESLESKSDDAGSESEEGVTTDEGIEGSEDDTEETEKVEKLKPATNTENVNIENLIE